MRTNYPILVRVLTERGPEYWAKELTATIYRHSRQIYYTPKFADLYLSLLLTNQAKINATEDALYSHFAGTSVTPGLLPKNCLV